MSDSDVPDGPEGHPAFAFVSPAELHEHMRKQFETAHALNESNVRRQDDFVEGLDEDQLRMFRGFLKASLEAPDYGQYMVGWVSAILKAKYKVCQYCGEKHESYDDLLTAHPDPTGEHS